MARATLKGKYEAEKNAGSAVATVAYSAGDIKLKASITDETLAKAPSLSGLLLSAEKPGSFILDYDVPRKDFRFQFMNSINVLEKPVNLTYIHFHGANKTTLDGTLAIDPANKLSYFYTFQTSSSRVKYAYTHGSLKKTVIEPSYDFSKKAWDFSVSRKLEGDDAVKASYESSTKNLKLEWSRDSKVNGIFKVAAAVNLAEEQKKPKLTAETTWNFDLL